MNAHGGNMLSIILCILTVLILFFFGFSDNDEPNAHD